MSLKYELMEGEKSVMQEVPRKMRGPCATETQLRAMQVCQNQVLRFVCVARRRTKTEDLLRMSNMMLIKQLISNRVLMTGLGYVNHDKPYTTVKGLKPRLDGPRTRGQSKALKEGIKEAWSW